jgi:hypothetical protein
LLAGQKAALWTDITTATRNTTKDQTSGRWEAMDMMRCIIEVSGSMPWGEISEKEVQQQIIFCANTASRKIHKLVAELFSSVMLSPTASVV